MKAMCIGHIKNIFLSAAFFAGLSMVVPAPALAGAMVFDRIVAVVGNESITWVDLRISMEDEFAPQMKGMSEQEKVKAMNDSEAEYLQSLILRKLQVQEAVKQKINATDGDIDAAVADIRGKHGLDQEAFRKIILEEGLEWDRYRSMIGDQISLQRIVDRMVRGKIPEPEAVEGASALYKVRLVLFASKEGQSPEDLRQRVESFLGELGAGASFEELEPRYSDGSSDILTIEESEMTAELKDALAGLGPGQISEPFNTDRGIMVVKMYERREPQDLERERLFNDRYRRWIKELLGNAYIDVRL